MAEQLAAHAIACRVNAKLERIDARRIVFADGDELPRAGVMAELHRLRITRAIAAEIFRRRTAAAL